MTKSFRSFRAEATFTALVPSGSEVRIDRVLSVNRDDHRPHGHAELSLSRVRVAVENIILDEGRKFEVAPGRLGSVSQLRAHWHGG
jgi:acyl-CoA dehydrogenase